MSVVFSVMSVMFVITSAMAFGTRSPTHNISIIGIRARSLIKDGYSGISTASMMIIPISMSVVAIVTFMTAMVFMVVMMMFSHCVYIIVVKKKLFSNFLEIKSQSFDPTFLFLES